MSKNSVADALRALATSDERRSETARLRDVFDEIEATLKAGVSRTAVLETLHQQGFKMKLKSFESALYRLRQKRKAGEETQPAGQPATAQGAAKAANLDERQGPVEEASESPPTGMVGGKLVSETILETPSKSYSFKQLQKEKESK